MIESEFSGKSEKQVADYPFKVLLLVGGKGTRLASITGNEISKGLVHINKEETITGLDHIAEILKAQDITEVALCAKHFSEQYEGVARELGYETILQEDETGTGGAVEEAINQYGFSNQYLVISVDTYFSHRDLSKLIRQHSPRTISWGVSKTRFESMNQYNGLVVDEATGTILGDITQSWWKGWNIDRETNLYVKGAVQMIDPTLYMRAVEVFKRISHKLYPLDLYWDIFPLIEEENRRKFIRQNRSVLNAVVFDDELIDFGTPERLELVREIYGNTQTI